MGCNPVFNMDWLGDKFDKESLQFIKKYIKQLKERKKELKAQLKEKGANVDDINAQLKEIKDARRELRKMSRAKQLFKIREVKELDDEGSSGFTAYDRTDNAVCMVFTEGNMGYLSHELKHGYQFMENKLSFSMFNKFQLDKKETWNLDNSLVDPLYDLTDERDAFKRGWAVANKSEKGIYGGFLSNKQRENGMKTYENTKDYLIYGSYIKLKLPSEDINSSNVDKSKLKSCILYKQ